jgi:hypothetical protein
VLVGIAAAVAAASTLALLPTIAQETPPAASAPAASAPTDSAPASRPAEKLLSLDQGGCIQDWIVLAGVPFNINPAAVKGNVEFVYGEASLAPRDGYVFRHERLAATRVLRWQKVSGKQVSLAACGGEKENVGYAVTYLVAPAAMKVQLGYAGEQSSALIRVNGQPLTNGQADLVAGRNTVLIRVADATGTAKFSLAVLDANRKPVAGVQVALTPETPDEQESKLQADPAFVLFPKPDKRISYVPPELSPKVKELSAKAIAFLLDSQQANGAWSDTAYPDSVGVTALCCLALLAEGNLPNQGPHGKALDKGLEFLLSSFKDEGVCASSKVEGYGVMYGHALATLALLEVNGNMPWRPELEDRISKALQTIVRYQRLDGGWRYELTKTGDSDISVTCTVLWTLGQARRYGYTVPPETVRRAMAFVEACGQTDGRFMYRLNGIARIQPHSGVGVAALYGAGRFDHALLPRARELIAQEFQRYSVADLASRQYLLFGSFFAALTMYSSGYDTWAPWYGKIVAVIESQQDKDGSVPDLAKNRVYTTALAAIILQAPYGYLSIFVQ